MSAAETVAPDAETIKASVGAVEGAVATIETYSASITLLEKEHPVDVVCDVTTKDGMAQAVAGRAAWRDPRIALEHARKAAKAPVLALGRTIDAVAASIESRLRVGELNYDDQIKAEERRQEAERERRRQEEAEALAAIRRRILLAFGPPVQRPGEQPKTVEQLMLARAEYEARPVNAELFGDLQIEAQQAKVDVLAWIDEAAKIAEVIEERERAHAAEAKRLAAERAAFAEEQRVATEARKKQQAEEDARLAADREARRVAQASEDAERERQRAEQAEQQRQRQAELDRQEAELAERRRAQDEAEAKTRREQEARETAAKAEAARKWDEDERQRAVATAAQIRIEQAAPAMLEALYAWGFCDAAPAGEAEWIEARQKRDAAVLLASGASTIQYGAPLAKRTRKNKTPA